MGSEDQLLLRAAAANGVELQYTDVFGHVHTAADDVTRALLTTLGVAAATDAELERALESERVAHESQVIDPTIVVRVDHPAIQLRVPKSFGGASVKLEIEWEGGELQH